MYIIITNRLKSATHFKSLSIIQCDSMYFNSFFKLLHFLKINKIFYEEFDEFTLI